MFVYAYIIFFFIIFCSNIKLISNCFCSLIEFAPLGEISEKHFDKIFDMDVKGLLFTVQKALPIFQDGGSIIWMASIGASKGSADLSITMLPRLRYVHLHVLGHLI